MKTPNGKAVYRIFIVEDNALYAKVLKKQLDNEQFEVSIFLTGRDCLKQLDKSPDIILLDYTLPDMYGNLVLKEIKEKKPSVHVIIISGQNDIDTAVELLKNGAYDYITKGADTREKLSRTIQNLYQTDRLRMENENLKKAVRIKYDFRKLIKGNSREIEGIFELMEKAVGTNISVSITGETGTGKELVAKGIHYNSKRKTMPFVAVNVSAIPEGLVESELFGHEKGAFTGADFRKIGKFEQANGGTLFLDEIADLDIHIQTKLLRVIQERELIRLGGSQTIPLDVRILTATHKDLHTLVNEGTFRQDLYYRLLGLPIKLPPLRYRGHDIILLAKYFIDEFCRENNLSLKVLSESSATILLSYLYPGNIRELKAIVELACVMSPDRIIEPEHLNLMVKDKVTHLLASEKTLDEYTEDIIQHFLIKYDHNVRVVANKLNIGKSTIYRMLQSTQN
jgi:two-component system, NtrC family, response regulator AtoC